MFTGVILYFLLKEFGSVEEMRIRKVIRNKNDISIDFGRKSLTAHLNPSHTYLSLEKIKGESFYSSFYRGEKVLELKQNGLDRLLEVHLSGGLWIIFELFGRHSDCLLLKDEDIIHSIKGIERGRYEKPNPSKGVNLLNAEKDRLVEAIHNGEFIIGLTTGFVNKLRKKEKGTIERFAEREYKPTIFNDLLSPFALPEGRSYSSMNRAVMDYFSYKKRKTDEENSKKEILRWMDREIKRLESTIERLSRKESPDDYRLKGEALLVHLNEIEKGIEEVSLPYPGDKELKISLVSNLSPQENAERYFRLYKKAKRRKEIAGRKIKNMQKKLQELERKKERIGTEEDIVELGSELKEGKRKERITKPPHIFREFTTVNGYQVLVGKGPRSNHELTFHYARPYDIFFHVKNASGSHTILRLKDKNKIPPMEDIEEAATFAARFSKLKGASIIPVSYTERKYVKSGKGLPPGRVLLEREKVIYVSFA
ncbi:DUF814 domain-containing protein [candidate division WOR-3 bacterium]|nr:DUF814 domain-containing protein [candidate division WOR-3 bacterium]MCK4528655.1 DUF814 domain-containing protein [candidate division WOR-3 bacterium]